MAHYQNQYSAVPLTLSKDPIQKEIIVETTVVHDGAGSTHVIANDEYDKTTATDSTSYISVEKQKEGKQHHQQKKGMIEKIKEKLHGTHHQNN